MSLFWQLCAAIGLATVATTAVLLALIAWCAWVAPHFTDRRRRREAIEQLIAETRVRPRTPYPPLRSRWQRT